MGLVTILILVAGAYFLYGRRSIVMLRRSARIQFYEQRRIDDKFGDLTSIQKKSSPEPQKVLPRSAGRRIKLKLNVDDVSEESKISLSYFDVIKWVRGEAYITQDIGSRLRKGQKVIVRGTVEHGNASGYVHPDGGDVTLSTATLDGTPIGRCRIWFEI